MFSSLKRWVGVLAMALLLSPPVLAEDKPAFENYEAWFVMNMGGKKAGHMHVELVREADKIISRSAMKIAIKRGQTEIVIEQNSQFIETLDFKPISAESEMKLAAMAQHQKLEFKEDKWVLTSVVAGNTSRSEVVPAKPGWLTPGGLDQYMRTALERGDKKIEVRTLDLAVGTEPVLIKMEQGKTGDVEVFGRTVPATLWTLTMPALPGVKIEQWSDAAGQPVRQTVPLMPGLEMEMLLADKQLALADFDAPEMLAATLLKPDKPIKNPRKLKRAVYELSSKDLKKKVGKTVPNASHQKTKWIDANTLQVEIDLKSKPDGFDKGFRGVAKLDERMKEFWQPSAMLNYKDEAVTALYKRPVEQLHKQHGISTDDFVKLAYRLRDIARDHIEAKDLSVGFASASETARTGQGDCTEHACLLAAMLRGAGIPSRTVTGLVYADQFVGHQGIFGFHMWTQAWITTGEGKGYWLDLDAAMPGDVNGFDATHIALSTSSMKDGETLNDMVTMLPLMQGLKIKVAEQE